MDSLCYRIRHRSDFTPCVVVHNTSVPSLWRVLDGPVDYLHATCVAHPPLLTIWTSLVVHIHAFNPLCYSCNQWLGLIAPCVDSRSSKIYRHASTAACYSNFTPLAVYTAACPTSDPLVKVSIVPCMTCDPYSSGSQLNLHNLLRICPSVTMFSPGNVCPHIKINISICIQGNGSPDQSWLSLTQSYSIHFRP